MQAITAAIGEGRSLLERGNLGGARSLFLALEREHPESPDVQLWLARLDGLDMNGDKERAISRIKQVLERFPASPEAQELLGAGLLAARRAAEALPILQAAVARNDASEGAHLNLGVCHCRLGNLDLAANELARALEINPDSDAALYEKSLVLALRGKLQEAISALVATLRINPLHLPACLTLGSLYRRSGHLEQLITLYEGALKVNPRALQLREELFDVYLTCESPGDAHVHARALAEQRGGERDWLRAGESALALGKFEEAEQAFANAARREPQGWEAHYRLGELYLAARLYDAAEKALADSIARAGDVFLPFNAMGQLLMHAGRPAEAHEYLLSALERAPMRPEPVLNAALACAMRQDWSSAERFALAAASISAPGSHNHSEATRLLSEIQAQQAPSNQVP
ncbi:MAG: tetratricopeptide repeat protein [Candidatus Schekmanbacteria bacterium]|nr:tetratricopeptide repeat protein [Candidatus Schekmanbacteria bacterium]